MNVFLCGALAMASVVASLLLLRSWRVGRDRLFVFFALAFVAFAVNWIALGVLQPHGERAYVAYLPRLVGFVCIIVGIVDKNRRRPRAPGDRASRDARRPHVRDAVRSSMRR